MKKDLVTDEAILSVPCEPATADDAAIVQDLIDTLAATDDAACLAANQIGITKAIGVYADDANNTHVLLNPKLLMGLHATKVYEGCLCREEPSLVKRFARIKVSFDDIVDGKLRRRTRDFEGWEAQMVQHIMDHNAGKLV